MGIFTSDFYESTNKPTVNLGNIKTYITRTSKHFFTVELFCLPICLRPIRIPSFALPPLIALTKTESLKQLHLHLL